MDADLFVHLEYDESIRPFLEAAKLDSTFLTPIIWAAAAHANIGRWPQCDSLLRIVDGKRAHLGPLDRGLLDLWLASVRGDDVGRYNAARRMLAESPESELARFLAGVTAIRSYRTAESIALLRHMPIERSTVRWDIYGTQLATAYHVASRYDEELTEARRRRGKEPRWLPAMMDEGRALVALGRSAELRRLSADISALSSRRPYTAGRALHFLAQEARVSVAQAMSGRSWYSSTNGSGGKLLK